MSNPQVNIEINAGGNASVVLNGLNKQFGSFFQTLKAGFNLNLGAKLAELVLGIPRAVVELAAYADGLKDSAEAAGIAFEAYQVLSRSLKQSGADTSVLTAALTALRKAEQDAAQGVKSTQESFAALGIDAEKLAALPLPLQLEQIGKAMVRAGSSTEAFNAVADLLGSKNAPKLRSTLQALADQGFTGLAAAAQKTGAILDDDTATALGKIDDALGDLKTRMKNVAADFLLLFEPFITFGLKVGNFLIDVFQRVVIAINRVLRAIGALLVVATSDLTLAEANKMLEDAAADDLRKLNGKKPVSPGPAQVSPSRQIKSLRDLNDAEKTQYESLLSAGDLRDQQTRLQLAEIARRFSLTAEQRRIATDDILKGRLLENQSLDKQLRTMLATLKPDDPRFAGIENAIKSNDKQFVGLSEQRRDLQGTPSSPGEGLVAGATGFLDSLGTQAQQVAAAVQTTLGSVVTSISDGIQGWVTGAMSFGSALQQIGSTILQTLLQSIIRMGVEWVVSTGIAKAAMISLDGLQSFLLGKKVVEVNAAEAATLPAKTAGAVTASISSFGVAAAIGLVAVLAALAAFGGFAEGGYTGAGGKFEPAGIVHKGEYVFSQDSVARVGINNLSDLDRFGRLPGYATGGLVGALPPMDNASGRAPLQIVLVDSERSAKSIARNSEAETQIINLVRDRRYEILA